MAEVTFSSSVSVAAYERRPVRRDYYNQDTTFIATEQAGTFPHSAFALQTHPAWRNQQTFGSPFVHPDNAHPPSTTKTNASRVVAKDDLGIYQEASLQKPKTNQLQMMNAYTCQETEKVQKEMSPTETKCDAEAVSPNPESAPEKNMTECTEKVESESEV